MQTTIVDDIIILYDIYYVKNDLFEKLTLIIILFFGGGKIL